MFDGVFGRAGSEGGLSAVDPAVPPPPPPQPPRIVNGRNKNKIKHKDVFS